MTEENTGKTAGSARLAVSTVRLQKNGGAPLKQRPAPFARRATYLRGDGEGGLAVCKTEEYPLEAPGVAAGGGKSPKISSAKKEVRVLVKACKAYLRHYKALAKRSDQKRRDGARKDFGKNSFWASKKASEILRNESGLYNRAKFAKRLHAAVLRHQEKTLGK